MAVIRTLSVLSMLLASIALAQPSAVIGGPAEMDAGNMVVLNAVASKGDAKAWIFPENLAGRYAQVGEDQVFFAVRESGEFTFHLIVVESGDPIQIATATHTVKITNGIGETNPVDPDPDEPGPIKPDPPAGDFEQLRELSFEAAQKLDDSDTASELAKAIDAIKEQDLMSMKVATRVAIEGVFAARKGMSRDKDWAGVWRRPVDESIQVSTPAEYRAALSAIAAGLRSAAASGSVSSVRVERGIVMYTHPSCTACQQWKRDVKPAVLSMGYTLSEIKATGTLPVFEVTVDGVTHRMVGYQSASIFKTILDGSYSPS